MNRPAPRIALDAGTDEAIDGRHLRAVAFNGVRIQYVREMLARLGVDPAGRRTLVIGNPVNLVKAVLARRSGRISDDGVAPMVDFVLEKPGARPLVTYLGCARRA